MKKIFTIVVLAVAAFAMVSCNKAEKQVEESISKAVQAKDVKRLVAIGDSIKGLGDKADAKMMVEGVKSYAAAFDVMVKNQNDSTAGLTMDMYDKYYDNFIALYDATNKKDADVLKKSADDLKKVDGGLGPDELIAKVKQAKDAFKQAEAAAKEIQGAVADAEANAEANAEASADGGDDSQE